MRKSVLFLAALVWASLLLAVPARRVRKTITVDGRQVAVTLTGNENLHYWLADDGTAYTQLADSSYARLDIAAASAALRRARRADGVPVPGMAAGPKRTGAHVDPILGKRKGLVILVNTTDVKFTCSDDPNALFNDMMNKEGFNHGTATGSVREYFRDQSFGQLDYEFDVVGPVELSHEMAHYGSNTRFEYESGAVGDMIYEAVKLADKEVNFKDYDTDDDGEVENIYIIYAGYSEAHGAPDWTIWPHAYRMSYINYWNKRVNALRCDGVKVDSYACSSEFRGTSGKKIDGIGTICHEFSHCLGLPDWYSTVNAHNDYTNAYWSILDTGTYSNDGDTPAAYTAYERWFCGWMEPVELKNDTTVSGLTYLDDDRQAYVYYNEGNRNEFYILHNIQQKGWSKYAYGHGLAVFHVDVDEHAWEYDEVNNFPDHLRMQLVCADNIYSWETVFNDLYPNIQGNNRLTSTSKPACKVFNQNIDGTNMMGKNLTNIRENSKGEISFKFTVTESIKKATAVEDVNTDNPAVPQLLYNLSGQKVSSAYKGLVIAPGGRKILVK